MPTPTATATDGTMTSSSATMGTTVTSTPAGITILSYIQLASLHAWLV